MSITNKDVESIEALLPFLFGIRGAGEAAARDAAESLMELLDTTVLPPGSDHPKADACSSGSRSQLKQNSSAL